MKNKIKYPIQEEETLISSTIRTCIQEWPLFLTFLLILSIASFVYLKFSPTYYQANALLIIKDEKRGNEESKLMESLNLMSSKKIIENEVQVLQSRAIIQKVVKNLYLNAPIYVSDRLDKKRAFLTSPIFIEIQSPESIIESDESIGFEFDKKSQNITLNKKLVYPLNQWVHTPYGILRFIKNSTTILTKDHFYFKLKNNESAVNSLLDMLKVTATNKLSSVINLQYRDGDPSLAEAVLNELINNYYNLQFLEKKELAKNTLKFIDARLNIIGSQLDSIDNQIKQFKGASDAVDISTQGQLFLQNVSVNDQKLSDIELKLGVLDEMQTKIANNKTNIIFIPSTIGVMDPSLAQLVATLNEYELQREKIKNTTASNNPLMLSLNEQIIATKERINDYITTYKTALEKSKTNYQDNNVKYASLLESIPSKEQGLLEISRDRNIKSDIYAFLLQKREESEIAYASTITDNSIITNAHASSTPVSPNHLIVLGSAMLLLFGFPVGLTGFRDLLNGSIRYRSDIESVTNIPIIGEIALSKRKDQFFLDNGENSNQYESFRKIRYALSNRGMGSKNNKLLITSGISGEGKSYIATNLALSFADAGKKIVLIDCDFKQAHMSKSFNLSNEEGVTDFLAGLVTEKAIIHSFPAYKNLYFIPAGSVQERTTALLENGSIGALFDYLEDHFDLVIIDTAPLINVADGYLLANYCDTTLFVVKHGYSPKNILEYISADGEINGSNDTVILYNGVQEANNRGAHYKGLSYSSDRRLATRGQVKLLN